MFRPRREKPRRNDQPWLAQLQSVGPRMRPRRSRDELTGDANPAAGLTYRSFEDIAHTEIASNLADVDRAALVGKRLISAVTNRPRSHDKAVMMSSNARRPSTPARYCHSRSGRAAPAIDGPSGRASGTLVGAGTTTDARAQPSRLEPTSERRAGRAGRDRSERTTAADEGLRMNSHSQEEVMSLKRTLK